MNRRAEDDMNPKAVDVRLIVQLVAAVITAFGVGYAFGAGNRSELTRQLDQKEQELASVKAERAKLIQWADAVVLKPTTLFPGGVTTAMSGQVSVACKGGWPCLGLTVTPSDLSPIKFENVQTGERRTFTLNGDDYFLDIIEAYVEAGEPCSVRFSIARKLGAQKVDPAAKPRLTSSPFSAESPSSTK